MRGESSNTEHTPQCDDIADKDDDEGDNKNNTDEDCIKLISWSGVDGQFKHMHTYTYLFGPLSCTGEKFRVPATLHQWQPLPFSAVSQLDPPSQQIDDVAQPATVPTICLSSVSHPAAWDWQPVVPFAQVDKRFFAEEVKKNYHLLYVLYVF